MEEGRQHAYSMIGVDAGKSIKAPTTIRPSLSVTNVLFNQFVEEAGLLKAEEINDVTNEKLRKRLAQAISDGISTGATIADIKNSILDICDTVYSEMSDSRAMKIARTEAGGSVNAGTYMTAKAEGMQYKTWLSTRDERTRGQEPHDEFDHLIAEGETVPIDSPFVLTGQPLMYPGDSDGDAANIINCRCSFTISSDEINALG
jgi:uncharacterized protein with gpF-like domain